MSAEIEIRPTTYAEWYALEEERDQLRDELDRLRAEFAEIRQASEWLDSLKEEPEDRRDEEIFLAAQRSFRRWKTSVHGCMSTKADSIEYHLIWATLDWARRNMVPELDQQVKDLRSELAARSAPVDPTMPNDREELQKLLNEAHRRGNQEAHEAHRIAEESGLKAACAPVAAEVPELTNEEREEIYPMPDLPENEQSYAAFWRAFDKGWQYRASKLQILDPSRILKDGEIHGTPEEIAKVCEGAGWLWMGTPINGKKTLLEFMVDALRSGEAEWGNG